MPLSPETYLVRPLSRNSYFTSMKLISKKRKRSRHHTELLGVAQVSRSLSKATQSMMLMSDLALGSSGETLVRTAPRWVKSFINLAIPRGYMSSVPSAFGSQGQNWTICLHVPHGLFPLYFLSSLELHFHCQASSPNLMSTPPPLIISL